MWPLGLFSRHLLSYHLPPDTQPLKDEHERSGDATVLMLIQGFSDAGLATQLSCKGQVDSWAQSTWDLMVMLCWVLTNQLAVLMLY